MAKQKSSGVNRIIELLYTGLYAGYVPYAPGTWGTLLAWLLYVGVSFVVGPHLVLLNAVLVVVLLYPAILLGDRAEKIIGEKDPQVVVFDEMMGFWITMFCIPYSLPASIMGLVLFRIFDILKPWPIKQLQYLKGGLGIMIDDYIAGILSNILLWAVILSKHVTGVVLL